MDVGFLLSYFALAGLICFQSPIAVLWQPRNFIANATWQSFTASFAATISTLPFTLFYFKQFPIWFFVCNIVVIPATFVILLLALLVVLKFGPAAYLINVTMIFLNWFIGLFNIAGYGFIDMIDFTAIDALYLSLLIVFITFLLQQRSFVYCRLAFVTLICWQLTALFFSYQSKTQSLFTLYSIRNKTAITVKNRNNVWMTPIDTSDYNYNLKPHVTSFNNSNLTVNHKLNYLSTKDERILILDQSHYFPKDSIAVITTLLLCNNVKLMSYDLLRFPRLKRVVMDVSNKGYNLQKMRGFCEEHKISLYSVADSGAFLLPL
jgi:competence protein ComEC